MVAGLVPNTKTALKVGATTPKLKEKLLSSTAENASVPPDQETITAGYIAVLKANKGDGPLTYMSTPITGGQKKYDFLAALDKTSKAELSEAESRDFEREVIGYNSDMAKDIAECLETNPENGLVLNPGTLNVPGWTQRDYLNHWLAVVKEVADKVVLVPGWQLSKGCVYEAREALNKGIPVQEIQLEDLDRAAAQQRVQQAVEMLQTNGFEKDATMGDILQAEGFHEEWYLNHA